MHTRNRNLFVLATWISCAACFADEPSLRDRNDAIIVRAIERMKDIDIAGNEHVQQAIARHIARNEGTAEYIELAARFRPEGMVEKLTEIIHGDLHDSVRVRAMGLLVLTDAGREAVRELLSSGSMDQVKDVSKVLALLGNGRSQRMLADVVSDAKRPYEHRKYAVIAMSLNQNTSKRLLSIAETNKLPADTRLLAGGLLSRSNDQEVRSKAIELFPQVQLQNRDPLPAIDQLAQLKGDASNGAELFRGVATCGNCHPIAGQGKQVGPELTEIGSKLSREAMLTSILDPSAGISHNYEGYVVLTGDGQVITGLLISKTDDELVIRTTDAIDRKIASENIESVKQSDKSIMPENLHHLIGQQGLVDVVEYMTTLQKQ